MQTAKAVRMAAIAAVWFAMVGLVLHHGVADSVRADALKSDGLGRMVRQQAPPATRSEIERETVARARHEQLLAFAEAFRSFRAVEAEKYLKTAYLLTTIDGQ